MPDPTATVNINTVLLAVITMVGTCFGAWLTYRANATHKAVNSERTAMTDELKKQNAVIAQLAAHLGALTGSHDLTELAKLAQAGLPVQPALSTTTPAVGGVVAQIVVPAPPPASHAP